MQEAWVCGRCGELILIDVETLPMGDHIQCPYCKHWLDED
jgi:DNA-directed RNA polymerase subunit RPC12/RpoP